VISAGDQQHSEYEIKAAFIYNFAKFITWPATQEDSKPALQICVLGRNPFGDILKDLAAGKEVNGRPIEIIYRDSLGITALPRCDIVFISESLRRDADTILRQTRSQSMLTIADWKSFTVEGGMIGLYLDDNKVRFQICPQTLKKANLSASSQLLRLASVECPG